VNILTKKKINNELAKNLRALLLKNLNR